MDLRKFPATRHLGEEELLSLWWYQPYIFSDDIVSGVLAQNFIKHIDKSIVSRSEYPKHFSRFWDLSNRTAVMLQDWG